MGGHLDPDSSQASLTMVVVFPPSAAQMMIRLVDGIENVFGGSPRLSCCEEVEGCLCLVVVHVLKQRGIVGKGLPQDRFDDFAPIRFKQLRFKGPTLFICVVVDSNIVILRIVLILALECRDVSVVVRYTSDPLVEQDRDLKKAAHCE